MTKILITGSSGFIGKVLTEKLIANNYLVHASSRNNHQQLTKGVLKFNIGEIDDKTNWEKALAGVNCIIHCAAKTHEIQKLKKDLLNDFRKVNTKGTINLAEQASIHGVKRLIFLSSIKVNGERTSNSSSFKYDDIPNPEDAYGISKWEAEQGLWQVSQRTGLEVVIIRAPLVLGYGAKGNLGRLMKLINSGIPLPLSLIKNQRSFIGIDNLIDVLFCCINHPNAKKKTFLVSDGEDISTFDLINQIANAMGKSSRLFPIPISVLNYVSYILRRKNEMEKLIGSLKVDNSYTKEILNWKPSASVAESIRRMVQDK